MTIKSNASPHEKDSPFYKKNEKFCLEFEQYILGEEGEVKGNYNSWSYAVIGEISNPKNWTLKYKKSTFSSGSLWLSSKYQNLLVLAEWTTKRIETQSSEFLIRRKTKTDFLNLLWNKSLSKFGDYNEYIIESKVNKPQLISKLEKILEPLFKSGEVYKINHRDNKLKIELRTDKHYFEIFEKLAEL